VVSSMTYSASSVVPDYISASCICIFVALSATPLYTHDSRSEEYDSLKMCSVIRSGMKTFSEKHHFGSC
jgi:hypothetical protein